MSLSGRYAYYRVFWQVLEQVQRQLHPSRMEGMGRPYHELSLLQLLDQPEWKENQTWRRLPQGEFLKRVEWLRYLPREESLNDCVKT